MFVVWGSKVQRVNMGRYADFCCVCRKITAHRVTRFDSARHVYFVSVESDAMHTEFCCQECRARTYVEGEISHEVSFDKRLPLEDLIRKTNPDAWTNFAERLQVEARLSAIDPVIRLQLIREPFLVLSDYVLTSRSPFNSGVVVSAAVTVAAYVLLSSVTSISSDLKVGAVLALALISFLVVARLTSAKRMLPIVRALVPLRPSLEEITDAVADVEAADDRLRRQYDPARIYKQIQAAPVWLGADGSVVLRDDVSR